MRVTLDIATFALRPDVLMPLALVLNEAVSNAFLHGYPTNRTGHVRITLARGANAARLTVEDDGAGLTTGGEERGLGMRVIRLLAAQLQGQASVKNINPSGACFALQFPIRCVDN